MTLATQLRTAAVAVAVIAVMTVSGCATNKQQTAETVPPGAEVPSCAWTTIGEMAPEGGDPTRAEALAVRIAWNHENPQKEPARGEEFYPRSDETLTLEAALRSLPAAEKALNDPKAAITIDAIDASGADLGDVLIERFPQGYFISQIAVTHNTSGLRTGCE